METLLDIGKLIRTNRTQKNWNVETLAEKSGVERAYIIRIETGKVNATIKTIQKLVSAMDMKLMVSVH